MDIYPKIILNWMTGNFFIHSNLRSNAMDIDRTTQIRHERYCINCDVPAEKSCSRCGLPLCKSCAKTGDGVCNSCAEEYRESSDYEYGLFT